MKVRDIMIRKVFTCAPDATLESVAMTMWNEDCGALPVVDQERRLIGMITDRDICMATAFQHRAPAHMNVQDVLQNSAPVSCKGDATITDALKLMRNARIRRLPVVDGSGRVQGILSVGDVVTLAPSSADNPDMPLRDVIGTLKSVSGRHQAAAA